MIQLFDRVRNPFAISQRLLVLFTLFVIPFFGGCGWLAGDSLIPGTYTGTLSCTLLATDATGMQSQEDFDAPTTLVINADGEVTLDGTELTVGAMLRRSISTADLDFQITELNIDDSRVSFTAEPRPTLPGLSATGQLTETYVATNGAINASRELNIEVTDIETAITFASNCEGWLTAD